MAVLIFLSDENVLFSQTKGIMNSAVSAAVQAVRGRGRGALTRGAFVGATAAPGYIAPGTMHPMRPASLSGPRHDKQASPFLSKGVQERSL